MQDRRTQPRGRTFIGGKIDFNNSFCVLDCLVRDMSEGGARLVLAGATIVPNEFDLRIPQKNQTRRVRLAWSHNDKIGVTFVKDKLAA